MANTAKHEAYKPRQTVINASDINDYEGFVKFRPAKGLNKNFADKAAVIVNCFIRRMKRKAK